MANVIKALYPERLPLVKFGKLNNKEKVSPTIKCQNAKPTFYPG